MVVNQIACFGLSSKAARWYAVNKDMLSTKQVKRINSKRNTVGQITNLNFLNKSKLEAGKQTE